ncbi:hypothetical protein SS50377_24504 [Spironucleus salmonicida]|uniref:Uncharacterized protein n=1 Tax=Spironucleus salmonicida TaxID=348837 RepID=V6LNY3_9EUKA|nr:hypothetical protein SS50377_24504 [Spironucleus salmonicida]|eukprot:EST45953.1 Hypothetical protein SS50377_13932 [Spironucleus salmonicida]
MQYNIPPLFYIENFNPTILLAKNLTQLSLCKFLDPNFNEESQQIIIAADFLLLPINKLSRQSLTPVTILQILFQWKQSILNEFQTKFINFANFIANQLNQFMLFVEQNSIFFTQLLQFIPQISHVQVSEVFTPAISIPSLQTAKFVEFYEKQAEERCRIQGEKDLVYQEQISYDYRKMCIEEKFGGLMQVEILNCKEKKLQDQERAKLEMYNMQSQEYLSLDLSELVRTDLEKRVEQQKIDTLVAEKLSLVQQAVLNEIIKQNPKKK